MNRVGKILKYSLTDFTKAMAVYYLVMVLIVAFWIAVPVTFPKSNVRFNGIEGSTPIFLLVAGLVSFRASYLFLQAFGVTRRQYYTGALLGMAAVAALMTAADSVLGLLSGLFMTVGHGLPPLIYPGSGYAAGLLWTLALNLAAILSGWFITMMYYRCGKWLKLVVSLSPALFLAAMLMIDSVTGNGFSGAIAAAVTAAMGFGDAPNILPGICTLFAASAALAGFCYLLVRRAPVKEQTA